jgi:hypothetical protein
LTHKNQNILCLEVQNMVKTVMSILSLNFDTKSNPSKLFE